VLSSLDAHSSRKKAWLTVATLCAAMLFLPLLTWILVPSPGAFTPPPAPARAAQALPTAAPVTHTDLGPRPIATAAAPTSDAPITGTVLDPDGKPVRNAFVGCDDRDKELATSTDTEGRFRLAAGAAGCLAVAHTPDLTPSEPTALVAGRENVIRLRAAGGIDGVVVDEKGTPLSPYLVGIESFMGAGESAETIPPTGQARTIQDPKGAFLWEGLMPGKYVLTASAEGRPPTKSSQIEVEAGRTTHHVRIVLGKGAVLSGKVTDAATHKPVAGAIIALDAITNTTANSISPARSDDTGAYSLEGVPGGPFSIRVASDKYRTRIISGLTTHDGAALAQDIALTLHVEGGADSEMAGVGAMLAQQDRGVTVTWVMPVGPGATAGLRTGDLILKIDGSDARALSMVDCVQRLRGPEGSQVAVVVQREGAGLVTAVITRQNIVR
jgi:protocatechuate 3,4-dioxygenase beta subunit